MGLVRQWLSRHSNPIFWVGGTSTCILGVRGGLHLDLVGLGWAGPKSSQVDQAAQGHSTATLQAQSTSTIFFGGCASQHRCMVDRCLAAQEGSAVPAAAQMEQHKV